MPGSEDIAQTRMENISIRSISAGAIRLVSDEPLRGALQDAFSESDDTVAQCDRFFELLPTRRWSTPMMARILASWKATHLKMLAIYGLSCRLQRLALASSAPERERLLIASAHNAATSYEDLGLDYDGVTHAALYDQLVHCFIGDFPWQYEELCSTEAREFQRWIYRNMVVSDIGAGLYTNMLSEVYNHGEYTVALAAFSRLADDHYRFDPETRERALTYVRVHVVDETEVGHFLVVVDALEEYRGATHQAIDHARGKALFVEYLNRIGAVLRGLCEEMEREAIAHVGT